MEPLDPAVQCGFDEVLLAHHLGARLAGVYQGDYLPLEVLGELPGCLGSRMGLLSSKGPQTLIRLSN